MSESIELDHFPIKTYEKLRYADTDRQGHVNNAVFSMMFETGRVEILYDPSVPLASPNCAFVIVNLTLDFHAEITWPGRVDIGTRVSKVGRSSITFEQALFQNGRLTATAKTVVVQVNQTTRRSETLNDAAIERLNDLSSPK
ncbi:MAG: acyl-CoA thioesterase [Anaerolineae bacterium]|nr:acyl-CoA thioesterase [Anaerolineae bacterium]